MRANYYVGLHAASPTAWDKLIDVVDSKLGSTISIFFIIASLECLQCIGVCWLSMLLLICCSLWSTFCLVLELRLASAKHQKRIYQRVLGREVDSTRVELRLSDIAKYLYLLFDVVAFAVLVKVQVGEVAAAFSLDVIALATFFYACVIVNSVITALFFIRAICNVQFRFSMAAFCLIAISALVSVGLNIECLNSWPQYDSYAFVRGLSLKRINYVIEPNGLILSGHITDSYTLLGLLIKMLIPSLPLGSLYESLNSLYLLNMLTSFFGMILVYLIVKKLINNHSECFYITVATLFGVSPLFLGSSFMLFPDKLLLFGAILFVYSRVMNDEPLHLVALFIICTTKETGLVMAFSCSVFEVLLTMTACMKRKEIDARSRILIIYYVLALIVGIILFSRYIGSAWLGGGASSRWEGFQSLDGIQWNSIALSGMQAIVVLKAAFLTNFTWLFTIIIVIGIIFAVRLAQKNPRQMDEIRSNLSHYVFIILLGVSYLAGLCLFITSVRWRYVMPTVFSVYLLGVCAFDFIIANLHGKRLVAQATCSLIAVLLLAQSYITVDPVMLNAFSTISTGSTKMIVLDQNCNFFSSTTLSPSSEYNRQVGTFAKALDKALESVMNEKKKQLILFSREHVISPKSSATASIWGYGYASLDPPKWGHWNKGLAQRVLTGEQDGAIQFEFIKDIEDVKEYEGKFDEIFYIEMPWADSVIAAGNEEPMIETEYLGWNLKVYAL